MTEGEVNTFKVIPIILLFLLAFTTTFLHLFFNKRVDWKPYKNNNSVYDSITLNFDKKSEKLFNQFKTGQINNSTFINSFEKTKQEFDVQLKKYHQNKRKLKKEFSFLGYISFRYFLYALGFALFPLIIASLLLIMVLRLEKNPIQYKRIYVYGCIGFIYIAAFWLCHTLFATIDLPKWSYNISFVLLATLVTTIIYSLINRYNTITLEKIQRKKDIEEILTLSHEFLDMVNDDLNGSNENN